MNSLEETLKTKNSINGWLTNKEATVLYNLAKNCPQNKAIVEIGSWKGRSTVCLASGSSKGNKAKIYAIDPHTGSNEHKRKLGEVWTFDEFKENIKIAGLTEYVTPLVKTSEEASKTFDKEIGVLFIDGDHSFEAVKQDLELWFPKVTDGGMIVFHDAVTTAWKGVATFVEEEVYRSKRFKRPKIASSVVYAQKVKKNSSLDRLENRVRLVWKISLQQARYFAKKLIKRFSK